MTRSVASDQFIPRRTIAEIEPLDDSQPLEHVHGTIDRGQIASRQADRPVNFPDG